MAPDRTGERTSPLPVMQLAAVATYGCVGPAVGSRCAMKLEDLAPCLRGMRTVAIAVPLVVAGLAASDQVRAQGASLEGSWRGGGSVALANGQRERAQCRAQYRRASATSYTLTATCATPSG